MSYTDLWHCRKCGTMPEIVMLGKNFLIRCETCDSEKVNVYANNIDGAVQEWNRRNDPKQSWWRALFARLFQRE